VSMMSALEIRLPLDPSNVLVLGPIEGPTASEGVMDRDDLLDAHVGNFKLADWCEEWLYDRPEGMLKDGAKLYYWRWHNELRGRHGEIRRSIDIGRNEPCPCGTGKKFKRCHGK
jgi:SEC-C motif